MPKSCPMPLVGRRVLEIGCGLASLVMQRRMLAGFIDRHSRPKVEVIILDPDRGNRTACNRRMARLGYRHEDTRAAARQEGGEACKGRILGYRRGQCALR